MLNTHKELIGICLVSGLACVAAIAHGGRYFIIVFATASLIAFLEARRQVGSE
jgi:hypothetical protein